MRDSEKSIANVVLGLYFFPFLIALVFSFSTSLRHIGFAAAIGMLSVCGIVLFLTLKRITENKQAFEKKYNIEELWARLSSYEKEEAMMKQEKELLEQELLQAKEKEEALLHKLEKEAVVHSDFISTKEALEELKENMNRKNEESAKIHATCTELQKEVLRLTEENKQLSFELKTFVRVKSKSSRALLRSSQEEIPESANVIYN